MNSKEVYGLLLKEIKGKTGSLLFKSEVDYYKDLPSTNVSEGDCYKVKYVGSAGTNPDGTVYAWQDAAWISLSSTNVVKSVNGYTPDELGQVTVESVPIAENLYSPDVQSDYGTYAFRTAGGEASIENGQADLVYIQGNVSFEELPQQDVHRKASITIPKPAQFKAMGTNQFDTNNVLTGYTIDNGGNVVPSAGSFVCYVHGVGGLDNIHSPGVRHGDYTVYSENGHITNLGYSETIPAAGTLVNLTNTTLDSTTSFITFDSDGYICIAVSDYTDLCVHPEWSAYMNDYYEPYSDSLIDIPTKSSSDEDLPTADYGFPAVGNVRDEINLRFKTYTQRIGCLPYDATNLALVQTLDVDYIYDTDIILYVLTAPVVYTLPSSTTTQYNVADFGTEEFIDEDGNDIAVPILALNEYGTNLRDKLRTDVVTLSRQSLSNDQQKQVRENIAALGVQDLSDYAKSVNEVHPDQTGNINLTTVPLAENLLSPDNDSDTGSYIFRTAGGEASISDGDAQLIRTVGNSVNPTKVDESFDISVTDVFEGDGLTVTIDNDTWLGNSQVGYYSGTYTFRWSGNDWRVTSEEAGLENVQINPSSCGMTITGTPYTYDEIVVNYVRTNIAVPTAISGRKMNPTVNGTTFEIQASAYGFTDVSEHVITINYTGTQWNAIQFQTEGAPIEATGIALNAFGITVDNTTRITGDKLIVSATRTLDTETGDYYNVYSIDEEVLPSFQVDDVDLTKWFDISSSVKNFIGTKTFTYDTTDQLWKTPITEIEFDTYTEQQLSDVLGISYTAGTLYNNDEIDVVANIGVNLNARFVQYVGHNTFSVSFGGASVAEDNKILWRSLIADSGTYKFTFSEDETSWDITDEDDQPVASAIQLGTYGLVLNGTPGRRDYITIDYVKAILGHIINAQPAGFKSVGTQQWNPENVISGYKINSEGDAIESDASSYIAWVHACYANAQGWTIYSPAGRIDKVAWSEHAPTPLTIASLEIVTDANHLMRQDLGGTTWDSVGNYTTTYPSKLTNYFFNDDAGYIIISCSGNPDSDLTVHPRWSGYKNLTDGYSDETSYAAHSTIIDFPTQGTPSGSSVPETLPNAVYGMPKVGLVADEFAFDTNQYVKRIERIAYTTANLQSVRAMGVDYDYDSEWIYYVLITPVVYSISKNTTYFVADFGTEEYLATDVEVTSESLYGQNLRDKLRTDVVTLSTQTLTSSQKAQVNANIGSVPETRTVNNKALDSDITLNATDIPGAVRSVNGKSVDNHGNVDVNHVDLADNLYSLDNIESNASYDFRTAGGDESISSGEATLSYIRGNMDITGRISEVLNASVTPVYMSVDFIDKEAWRESIPGQTPGTADYQFTYDGTDWSYDGTAVDLANYGLGVQGIRPQSVTAAGSEGITVTVTNPNTWVTAMSNPEDGIYNYDWNGTTWSYNSTPITLSDYGLSATGEPSNTVTATTFSESLSNVQANLAVWETTTYASAPGYYQFMYDGTKWSDMNGVEIGVNLASIGVTYTGTPIENDAIQVEYAQASATIQVTYVAHTTDATITVNYTKKEQGTITCPKPVTFKSVGLNQFDKAHNILSGYTISNSGVITASAGCYVAYIHATGTETGSGNGNSVYSSSNNIVRVGWSPVIPTADSTVYLNGHTEPEVIIGADPSTGEYHTSDTTMLQNVQVAENGYICVATTNIDTLCVHPTWSYYENFTYEAYYDSTINIAQTGTDITTEEPVDLPTKTYGMPAIGAVKDELNLDTSRYTKRIGQISYTKAALEALLVLHPTWVEGTDYEYDNTNIFYVLDNPVNYNLSSVENVYQVADFGTEEFLQLDGSNIAAPIYAQTLYGQNLRDKLRTDVVTLSAQENNAAQKQQARTNISAFASDDIADAYSTSASYSAGDIVIHDNRLYTATGTTSGIWNPSYWSGTTVNQLLSLKATKAFTGTSMTNYPNNTLAGAVDSLYSSKVTNIKTNTNTMAYSLRTVVLPAGDFLSQVMALVPNDESITHLNVRCNTSDGTYTNRPNNNASQHYYITVYTHMKGSWVKMVCQSLHNNQWTYVNEMSSGTWGGWRPEGGQYIYNKTNGSAMRWDIPFPYVNDYSFSINMQTLNQNYWVLIDTDATWVPKFMPVHFDSSGWNNATGAISTFYLSLNGSGAPFVNFSAAYTGNNTMGFFQVHSSELGTWYTPGRTDKHDTVFIYKVKGPTSDSDKGNHTMHFYCPCNILKHNVYTSNPGVGNLFPVSTGITSNISTFSQISRTVN